MNLVHFLMPEALKLWPDMVQRIASPQYRITPTQRNLSKWAKRDKDIKEQGFVEFTSKSAMNEWISNHKYTMEGIGKECKIRPFKCVHLFF
mgnify:FL=1